MRIEASLYRRAPASCEVSPDVGFRMMSIAPTFELFTKGSCSLVAPVAPFSMNPLNVDLEIPVHPGLAEPVGGNPPVQLPAGSTRQLEPVPGPELGASGQPPAAFGR